MNTFYTLDKRDIKFFMVFGLSISTLLWISNKVKLPPQMERGVINQLFFDHIPFISIGVLFISIAVLLAASIVSKKHMRISNGILRTNIHLSRRISQMASPSVFLLIGAALPITIIAWIESEPLYLYFTFIFILFAFFIFGISVLSRIIAVNGRVIKQRVSIGVTAIVLFLIIGISIVNAYFDNRPMKVAITLDLTTYKYLIDKSNKEGITISQYIERIVTN